MPPVQTAEAEVLPPQGQAYPINSPTIRQALQTELRHTLNSRIFYFVAGLAGGLVVAILLHRRKGESIL
jgi:hypothetical protein